LIGKFSRIRFKLALTRGRAKIVRRSLVFGVSGGISFLDSHSANRVGLLSHCCNLLVLEFFAEAKTFY